MYVADCRIHYSRVALKKYVKANNNINATDKMFDVLFNKALKTGVEKGEFSQPKGKCLQCLIIEAHCFTNSFSVVVYLDRTEAVYLLPYPHAFHILFAPPS